MIHSVHADSAGNVWAQSLFALYKKQGQNFVPIKTVNSITDATFSNLHLINTDTQGQLIVGSDMGFARNDSQNNWIEFNPPGLWDTQINDLIIESDTKWIATRMGLHKITSDKKISIYNEENSDLPSSYINGLAIDNVTSLALMEKHAWIGTDKGLTKIVPAEQQLWLGTEFAIGITQLN